MSASLEIYGRLPEASEVGQILKIIPKKSADNRHYANVVLRVFVSKGQDKDVYTDIPFFVAPKLWGKFKPVFKAGDSWIFHYQLKGSSNNSGTQYYCNAHLKKATSLQLKTERIVDHSIDTIKDKESPEPSFQQIPDKKGVSPMNGSGEEFNTNYDDDFGY